MLWHVDMFGIDRGRATTKPKVFLYKLVNKWLPSFVGWAIPLTIIGLVIYVTQHFLIKYW